MPIIRRVEPLSITVMEDSTTNSDLASETTAGDTASKKTREPREMSTISFPYTDLNDAISLAKSIYESGALLIARDQLAARLGQQPNSGSFANKLAAARLFGLIDSEQGKSKLTPLGYAILDEDEGKSRGAKVEAFLSVPLYKKVHEEYEGRPLPPRPDGLETAFIGFGVAPKQGTNARLAFDRSARQAGFFEYGNGKLIMPVLKPSNGSGQDAGKEKVSAEINASSTPNGEPATPAPLRDSTSAELDPLIVALLGKIPKAGDKWGMSARARWLKTLAMNFAQVYALGEKDHDEMEIEIKVNDPNEGL